MSLWGSTNLFVCVFFKQKTAYEMRISDWSSDVCSSDLRQMDRLSRTLQARGEGFYTIGSSGHEGNAAVAAALRVTDMAFLHYRSNAFQLHRARQRPGGTPNRSEEHTSELQSLMRISYAVFCLKKKNTTQTDEYRPKRTY